MWTSWCATFLLSALLLAFAAPSLAEETTSNTEAPEPAIIATWKGGQLERSDYESWRAVHGLDDAPQSVHEMIFVRSLAEITRQRGLDALETRLELEATTHRVLVPVLKKYTEASVRVSDEEIEKRRRDLPEAFQRPRKVRLRNLHRRLDPEQPEATRRLMQELHQKLRDGADFETLAREHSQSQSRFRGGQLGFHALDDLAPPVAAAVEKLEVGQLTGVIEHDGGLTIMRLEEVKEAVVRNADEVRARWRKSLTNQRQKAAWADLQEELLESVEIRPPSAEDGSRVPTLEMPGYRLDAEATRTLLALQFPEAAPSTPSADRLESMLRRWGLAVRATQRARELGLDRDPEIAARLRWRREGALARRELVRRVDQRLALEEQAAEEEVAGKEAAQKENADKEEAELRRVYEATRSSYRQPARVRIDVIHFGEPPSEEPRVWLAKVHDTVRAVETGALAFEEAAKTHSIHPSGPDGGALGWRPQRSIAGWGPPLARALRTLEDGELCGLLRLETGLWVVRLLGREAARLLDFEEAREAVAEKLRTEKIREHEQAVRAEHLESLEIRLMP